MSIILANGRGQMGECLRTTLLENLHVETDDIHVNIYHTWNIEDKSKETQYKEYCKFKDFVDSNCDEKIIFISTKSQKECWYVHYKQMSESYLLQNCNDSIVLRFPTLIGKKGTLHSLKERAIEPYGEMELVTLQRSCDEILKKIKYKGPIKSFSYDGEKIMATTAVSILNA
jgi:hypothetical protein